MKDPGRGLTYEELAERAHTLRPGESVGTHQLIDVPLEPLPGVCKHGRRAMRVADEDDVPKDFRGVVMHFDHDDTPDRHHVLVPCDDLSPIGHVTWTE